MLWYILSSATHDMRFLARIQNLPLDEAQDSLWVLDFKSLKETKRITIPSIHDFDLICKTLNQNTKPSPNKEISFIENLTQWLKSESHTTPNLPKTLNLLEMFLPFLWHAKSGAVV